MYIYVHIWGIPTYRDLFIEFYTKTSNLMTKWKYYISVIYTRDFPTTVRISCYIQDLPFEGSA